MEKGPYRNDIAYRRRSQSLMHHRGQEEEASYSGFVSQSVGEQLVEQGLDLLYRRRWTVLLTFLAVMLAVAGYTLVQAPEYEAHSFVLVDLGGETSGTEQDMQDVAAAEKSPFARRDRTLAAELFLLETSETVAQHVAERLPSEQQQDTDEHTGETVRFQAVDRGTGQINALQITAIAPDAERAALLANLYAEEYVQLTQEASRTYLSASRALLEEQEEQHSQALQEVEVELEAYLRSHGGLNLEEESSRLAARAASLEAQHDETRIDLQTRQAALQSLEQELAKVNPQLVRRISSGVEWRIQAIQEKIAKLELAKTEMRLRYPDETGQEAVRQDFQLIDQQIQQLRSEVEQLSTQYVGEVEAVGGISGSAGDLSSLAALRRQVVQERIGINEMETRIGMMNERLADYRARLQVLPEQTMELAQLQRRRSYAEQMHQSVIARLQEVQVAEESRPGYAHILRKADPPGAPARPNVPRALFIGSLFGLFLGVGLAFAREQLDSRIYKADQLRERGTEVIGVVPNMHLLLQDEHNGHGAAVEERTPERGSEVATSLVAWRHPRSAIAETYRHLRTSVYYSLPTAAIQSLLVTSPGVGEGKSVTAANLAVVMAQAGRRTLLVDADLRRPQVHRLFGLSQQMPGLAEVLQGDASVKQAVVQPWEGSLHVLTAGREASSSVAEQLTSERIRELLDELYQQFDIVILDSPPVRAATDATMLAAECDTTLLVVRAGKTKVAELEHCITTLEGVGAMIIGTALNGFDLTMAYGHKLRFEHYAEDHQFATYGYYGEK